MSALAPAVLTGPDPWPLGAIQGFILRGYRMSFVRYFALNVKSLTAARAFLAGLAAPPGQGPRLTSAAPWSVKPRTCLNIGFTWKGLNSLRLPAKSLASFQDDPFATGSAASAATVGDVGQSDPSLWRIDDRGFDVMVVLNAIDAATLESAGKELATLFKPGFTLKASFDSQGLEGGAVYFGYQDGIAQPTLAGSPFAREPDGSQAPVDPGALLLGTASLNGGYASANIPCPSVLGAYGTYAAFRMLEQDVDGYEAQIAALAPTFGKAFGVSDPAVQKAALKAKLCGRWPNGAPLAVFPIQGNRLPPALPPERINNFSYNPIGPSGVHSQPDMGEGCPFGAHIRRGNPRDSNFVNGDPALHRILRRAMAYQQPYDANNRNTGERGLMGLFVCAMLAQQFEFLMANWLNSPGGFGPTTDLADPLIGTNIPASPVPGQQTPGFAISTPTSPTDETTGFPLDSFVTTRGSAYLFFPSIPGVAWIAAQTG